MPSLLIAQAGLGVFRALLTARLTALAPSESRSSVISGVTLLSRIGMLASLGVVQAWFKIAGPVLGPIGGLFRLYAWLAIALAGSAATLAWIKGKGPLRIATRSWLKS